MPSAQSLANPSTLSVRHRLEGQLRALRCSVGARGRITGRFTVELRLALLGALDMGQTELDRESTWNAAAGPH